MEPTRNYSATEFDGKLSDWSYGALGTYLTLVDVTALFGNGLMLYVFLKNRMFQKTINILILNVILADMLHAVLGIPFAAISTFRRRWMFGTWGCYFYGFVCYASILSSMCTYVAISMYRYAVMCRATFAFYLRQVKKIRVIVISIWVYACVWAAMPFMRWGKYTVEPYGTTCSIDWHKRSPDTVSYVISFTIFFLFVPLGTMGYWYMKIILTTKIKVSHGITQRNAPITDSRHGVSYIPDIEKRATKIILVTLIVYLIAWLPYGIIFIASAAGAHIPVAITVVPTIIATAQCAYNPIIYAIGHTKFKVGLKEILSATVPMPPVPLPQHLDERRGTNE